MLSDQNTPAPTPQDRLKALVELGHAFLASLDDPGRVPLETDFNELAGGGETVVVSVSPGDVPELFRKDRVLLYDADGNTCEGDVLEARLFYVITVKVDRETWRHGEESS